MRQNISTAVMQRRGSSFRHTFDFFPTPPWATRALCEYVIHAKGRSGKIAWDPGCGLGHMVRPLTEYFAFVHASDVYDYGYGEVRDFLFPLGDEPVCDWIITNPPFRLAHEFIGRALDLARDGVAMLVRIAFLEGTTRYKELFSRTPPLMIAQFSERVPMVQGRLSQTISTATAYCWLVWTKWNYMPSKFVDFMWIPPCRKRLERPEDYV